VKKKEKQLAGKGFGEKISGPLDRQEGKGKKKERGTHDVIAAPYQKNKDKVNGRV